MARRLTLLLVVSAASVAIAGARRAPGASSGGAALDRLLADLVVEDAWAYRGLTFFPVHLRRSPRVEPRYLTLEEALDQGALAITELANAQVNRIRVRNRSDHYVFFLAGEIIGGAKQDRMVEDDLLLPPHSKEIALGVYCTEHGRWAGRSVEFKATGYAAHSTLRQMAKETRSQRRVWAEVEQKAQRMAVPLPPTSAAREVYGLGAVQSRVRPYVQHFRELPERYRDACGVVVASGDTFLVADVFGQRRLFQQLWPKLLESYVLDAVERAGLREKLTRADAERFLGRAGTADLRERGTPGVGALYDLHSALVTGSVLVYRDGVVHLDLFPRLAETLDRPRRAPNLDYRRRQQQAR